MNKTINLLYRPLFLFALLILIVNDHILKAAYPGWLTGKLSDFAGLFVLAVFIAAIAGRYLKSSGKLIWLHIVIAASFVIWKVAPVEYLFVEINRLIDIPLPSRVKDTTDLMALTILPFSYLYIKRHFSKKFAYITSPAITKALSIFILVLTSFAIIATSAGKKYNLEPEATVETFKKKQRLIDIFEQTLTEKKIEVEYKNEVNDTTLIYRIKFTHAENPPTHDWPDEERVFVSYITLLYSPGNHTISVHSIDGWVINDVPGDKELHQFYLDHIIEPYLRKLE